MTMTIEALKQELDFFAEHRADLLAKYPGQFALVKGQALIGVFPTQTEAYADGFRRFLRGPFLVMRILAQEEAEQIPLLAHFLQRAHL